MLATTTFAGYRHHAHKGNAQWLTDEEELQKKAQCTHLYASGAENIEVLPLILGAAGGEPGIFVEIGANNGLTGSNTLLLERCFGWTGLLIEANPDTFHKLLQSGRNSTMINAPACPNGRVVQMSGTVVL